SSTPIAPQIKQNTADIAPLPELKEKSEPKQDIRPIFKARMIQPVTGKNELRPVFKASTRLQSRPITKSEPLVQPKPEIKPAAPAPVREIKIEDEPPSAPIVEVKVVQPEVQVKIIQPEVKPLESKPFEIHEVELHEAKVPRAEPELEHEQKPVLRAASPEPEASRGPEIQPEAIPKVEIGTQIKESEVNAPQSKPEPRSMFKKSQSLFKSEISASPSPLFKSKIKRDLKHESRPPVDIPETRAEPEPNEKPVLEAEPEKEIRPERHPARSRTRRELFPPRKSEVEVRESPLEDEPELEKVPEPEPKPDLPSGLPARKKTRRKLSEVPGELEDSEV
ncbi:MAG: hypothetical protein ACREBQ_10520, partial [Nitrososphaerales archaeon]